MVPCYSQTKTFRRLPFAACFLSSKENVYCFTLFLFPPHCVSCTQETARGQSITSTIFFKFFRWFFPLFFQIKQIFNKKLFSTSHLQRCERGIQPQKRTKTMCKYNKNNYHKWQQTSLGYRYARYLYAFHVNCKGEMFERRTAGKYVYIYTCLFAFVAHFAVLSNPVSDFTIAWGGACSFCTYFLGKEQRKINTRNPEKLLFFTICRTPCEQATVVSAQSEDQ